MPAAPAPPPAAAPSPQPAIEARRSSDGEELSEGETGFIRIEPLGTAEPQRAGITPAPRAAPTLTISITPSPGSEDPGLEEARRAERRGREAQRRGDRTGAIRHYTQAARLFEPLAKRPGVEGQQAREALEACRRALASLR